MDEKRNQISHGRSTRTFRAVHPTEREVLLARLLLQLIDTLGAQEALDVNLYNEVKSFAEPIIRGAS